jgi:hypothetical protein
LKKENDKPRKFTFTNEKGETVEAIAPSIQEVAGEASATVSRIMDKGSDKSTFGQWYYVDSIRYNSDRAHSHLCQALMQMDGNLPDPDTNGETHIQHLERALVRCAFLLFKARRMGK